MNHPLLRKLALTLWQLLPANPILVRVVSGASRRVRHLWLRAVYLAALVLVVFVSLLTSIPGQAASLTDLAKNASVTFKYASTAQLLLMCFLAPVFTASAITQERDAKTFNILLSTPLSSAQIVLGSLMSRLYFVIMLLLSGLPIFLITMVYGGVTARQVMESFALCAATAFITGALAIFVAMIGVGTRRTIFSFYLLIALYLLAGFLLAQWDGTWVAAAPANIDGHKMSWLASLNPFLALQVALNEVRAPTAGLLAGRGTIAQYALVHPSATYVAWTLIGSVILVAISMFFVRRGGRTGEPTWFTNLTSRFRRNAAGERTRRARTVWANPVAWREATARAASGAMIRWTIILGGIVASAVVYSDYARGTMPSTQVPMWLAGITAIQVALAMLIAANTAATSMTKEKESKTIEILLTTPLTPKYILWGKLRGLVSFASPLLAGPVVVLMVFALTAFFRGESPPAVWFEVSLELAGLLVVYTALVCVVGLKFSMTSRTNMIAVMSSVGTIILIFGAASAVGFAMVNNSGGEFGAFFAPFTPFTAIHYLISPVSLFDNAIAFKAGASGARATAFVGSAVAVAVYAFIVWRWYIGLVTDFDRTMRKQTGG